MKKAIEWFALAAVIALACALRYTDPYSVADLAIVPDSAQYAISGYNLAHGKGLWLYINSVRLPLMYPCGFPLILAFWYILTGSALYQAIYVILAFSLLSIILTWLFARSAFGALTAFFSALLLCVDPLYVGYSQVVISDMVSNAFIVSGLWMGWRASVRDCRSRWLWFFAGLSCGFAASVHLLSGVTLIPLWMACLLGARRGRRDLLFSLVLVSLGFLSGLAPTLVYNQIAFGNILTTGYSYWPRWGEGQSNFSLHYALRNTAVSERGDQRGNIVYYLWHFFGLSWPSLFAPYFPSILLLAIIGGTACFRRSEARGRLSFCAMTILLVLVTLAVLFCYSFQMAKFFLPLVPFVCILAGYGITVLFAACAGTSVRNRLLRIPAAALLVVTAWGCGKPFVGGENSARAPTWWYEGLTLLDRIAPQDAFLISGIDGVYVTHYFIRDTRRTYLPISREVEYVKQRGLPLKVATEDTAYLNDLLRRGKKVYMDGFTYAWWTQQRVLMERRFSFVPVASYYGGSLRLYELRARPEGPG